MSNPGNSGAHVLGTEAKFLITGPWADGLHRVSVNQPGGKFVHEGTAFECKSFVIQQRQGEASVSETPNYVWIVLTKDPKGVWAIDSVKDNAAAALARGEHVKGTRPGHESFVDRREVHG